MKPNTITPELTHNPEDIARQNRELRELCAQILPAARRLVRQGIDRRTAQQASAAQVEQADALLKSILAELDEYIAAQPDAELEKLSRDLANDEAEDAGDADLAENEQQWIDQMAGDWALAASAFWLELGDLGRQYELIKNLMSGQDDASLAAFDLIASRFHVGQEGRTLLPKLNQLTQPIYTIKELQNELSMAQYTPEYPGAYVHK